MTELQLFEKTELFIKDVELNHVNLSQVAEVVAPILGLTCAEVAVVDVGPEAITLDILKTSVSLEQIVGKQKALLEALDTIAGVTVSEKTTIHSEGILGLVNINQDYADGLPARVQEIHQQINTAIHYRAIVFPTGKEIIQGTIEDTNSPFLIHLLQTAGYQLTKGEPLEDRFDQVVNALRGAADMGYGLVITTGGVGAEAKDHIVEAILSLDPSAATPYIVYYASGEGRHTKNGVRIAVGTLDWTTFIALPGPNDEVQLVAPALLEGLLKQYDKITLAEELANILRAKLASGGTSNPLLSTNSTPR